MTDEVPLSRKRCRIVVSCLAYISSISQFGSHCTVSLFTRITFFWILLVLSPSMNVITLHSEPTEASLRVTSPESFSLDCKSSSYPGPPPQSLYQDAPGPPGLDGREDNPGPAHLTLTCHCGPLPQSRGNICSCSVDELPIIFCRIL